MKNRNLYFVSEYESPQFPINSITKEFEVIRLSHPIEDSRWFDWSRLGCLICETSSVKFASSVLDRLRNSWISIPSILFTPKKNCRIDRNSFAAVARVFFSQENQTESVQELEAANSSGLGREQGSRGSYEQSSRDSQDQGSREQSSRGSYEQGSRGSYEQSSKGLGSLQPIPNGNQSALGSCDYETQGISDNHDRVETTCHQWLIEELTVLVDSDKVGSPSPFELRQRFGRLSNQERVVLNLSLQGQTSREIAQLLEIRSQTVDKYRRNALQRMKASNLVELLRQLYESIYRNWDTV